MEGERNHVYPDGLRKAQRVINLASRFRLPLITLIDTQGADPGLEAEEQGIGNAIATTLSMMVEAPTPIVSAIIGEGGSEGALALGLSDRILVQQYAVYSPISLNHTLGASYHDHRLDREAAEALMLTSRDCMELGIADVVVPEPEGGAHLNPKEAANSLQIVILQQVAELSKMSPGKLLKRRYQKFRRMGEGSSFSLEAMNREVDLLMSISGYTDRGEKSERGERRSRNGRSQRRRTAAEGTKDGVSETATADVEVAASD